MKFNYRCSKLCFSGVFRTILSLLAFLFTINSTSSVWACGGFFCNANTPVNQTAERILFVRDTENSRLDMHIQIQYQGPPTEFGWILPTAPDVETSISSEALFVTLDRLYGPVFQLNPTYDPNCPIAIPPEPFNADNSTRADGDDVQVLSREAIGPYDRAIIAAENVSALRDWLNENEYQIPDNLDPKLQPYIDAGSVFVVIKLLPGQDSGDIVPLNLSFTGMRPSIPILPTAVAATPDMGIIAHVLDSARAVPVNYRHVHINEAVISWLDGGTNYPDVVSQAVDEAGGHAFVTDFAGQHESRVNNILIPYTEEQLTQIAQARTVQDLVNAVPDRTNPDFQRVAASHVDIPSDVSLADFFRCASCYDGDDLQVDGAAVANQLREEVNTIYEELERVFSRFPYLTRLYTTMSATEMDRDPIFSINIDMGDQSNIHVADVFITCEDEDPMTLEQTITLSDGRTFNAEAQTTIVRQEGESVRGADSNAASLIEQTFEAGQPELIETGIMDIPTEAGNEATEAGHETHEAGHETHEAGHETHEAGHETHEAGTQINEMTEEMMDNGSSEKDGCQAQQAPHSTTLLLLGLLLIPRRRIFA